MSLRRENGEWNVVKVAKGKVIYAGNNVIQSFHQLENVLQTHEQEAGKRR